MKKIILMMMFCGLLSAQADFVYQSGSDFMTTADLDGDGRSDLVLLDGSNATVQVGFQTSTTNITWSEPRSLGMDNVTGMGCGNILTNTYDVLITTTPLLNRQHLYHLNTLTQTPIPVALHVTGIGPEALAVLDIGGAGNTIHEDVISFSGMNGSSPNKSTLIRTDGTSLTAIASYTTSSLWQRPNEVEYTTGQNALALFIPSAGTSLLFLYDLSAGSLTQIDYIDTGLTNNPAYVSLIPTNSTYAHFLVWEEENSILQTVEVVEPSAGNYSLSNSVAYDLGAPISSVQLVQGAGVTRLAVIFAGKQNATIYDYNGSGSLPVIQTINPLPDKYFTAIVPLGTNDLITISSDSGTLAGALILNQRTFSGGTFVTTKNSILTNDITPAHANVMTFENEPFVDNTPHLLQLLHAGDWARDSQLSAGAISTVTEIDRGISMGLGIPHITQLGAANPSANYTLDNQLHDAISTFSHDAARGDEVATILVSPDPGTYGTSIEISFSTDPVATLYYRTDATNGWSTYTAPFTIFKDTTIQYYALSGSDQSIIRDATYSFTSVPSELDSDGDGIPDYVELANGLDPIESGLDSDGDGYTDLDELLAGTSPTNSASMPAEHTEQGAVYDMAITLYPYDGVANETTTSETNTQLRLYSAEGGQSGYAKTTNQVLYASVTNPAAILEGLSKSVIPPFLTAVSDTRFDVSTSTNNNQRGVELIGIYLQPDTASLEVTYSYQDGDLETEASNWLAAATSTYTNQSAELIIEELGISDTLTSMLIERKIADLLYTRATITNAWVSLFKGRTADSDMTGLDSDDIQELEAAGPADEEAYHLPTMISYIQDSSTTLTNLQLLTEEIYDSCSTYGRMTNFVGKYPLPADVLRDFLYSGELQSNYLATSSLTALQITNAYDEAVEILSLISSRTMVNLTLEVQTNSFDAACPVLYPIGGGTGKSLYDEDGSAYLFPITFTLQPGAQITLSAYSDVTWDLCPGTDPLEIISLTLTAVPTATGTDTDGNLLPDDYEAMFLAGSGGSATNDLDGDGYSDLQEYLDETDPANATSHGTTAESMDPPTVQLTAVSENTYDFTIDWPAAYAADFVFLVEYTDDLIDTPFVQTLEITEGSLSTSIDTTSATIRFYRAKMHLR